MKLGSAWWNPMTICRLLEHCPSVIALTHRGSEQPPTSPSPLHASFSCSNGSDTQQHTKTPFIFAFYLLALWPSVHAHVSLALHALTVLAESLLASRYYTVTYFSLHAADDLKLCHPMTLCPIHCIHILAPFTKKNISSIVCSLCTKIFIFNQ